MLPTVHKRMQRLVEIHFDGVAVYMCASLNYVWILVPLALFSLICSLTRERNHFEVRIYIFSKCRAISTSGIVRLVEIEILRRRKYSSVCFCTRFNARSARLFSRLLVPYLFLHDSVRRHICQIAEETDVKRGLSIQWLAGLRKPSVKSFVKRTVKVLVVVNKCFLYIYTKPGKTIVSPTVSKHWFSLFYSRFSWAEKFYSTENSAGKERSHDNTLHKVINDQADVDVQNVWIARFVVPGVVDIARL